MQYNKFSRPKQPRNKYGFVNQTNIIGSGAYYSNNGSSFNGDVEEILDGLKDFTGATEYDNGERGLVPAPLAGMQDYYFLKADGTWAFDPAYKWLHEWPDIGDPRGLEIDGDFNVTGTLNTMDLNVQGQAHFWELVIDKVRANGGQVIVSPSLFEVDWVGGTQIYEFSFKRSPFYKPEYVSSEWVNPQTDFTQWTMTGSTQTIPTVQGSPVRPTLIGKRIVEYKDIINFWNTTETNFTAEQFADFCMTNGLFAGRGVSNNAEISSSGNISDGGTGWGAYFTGLFEKEMRDEDGNFLPLRGGSYLPYDFDRHYMEYYKLLGTSDANVDGDYTKYVDTVVWKPEGWNDPRTCTATVYTMTTELKNKFLDGLFGTADAWANIVSTRPDIYYRFFCDSVGWWSSTGGLTPIEELPIDSEFEYVEDQTNPYVRWIVPHTYLNLYWHTDAGQDAYYIQQNLRYKIQYFAKRLWMRCDDGSRRTFNECQIGDMLRCRSFNIKAGVYRNVSNKDFWSFVVGTGEGSYEDDDGNSHEAFYVDLVYAMKYITPNGNKYYPLGTLFKNKLNDDETSNITAWVNPFDSTHGVDDYVEVPEGWDQNIVQILNLKNVSKDTLTGLRDCIEEFPTDEEFAEAVDLVLQIRGGISNLNEFAGTDMGEAGRSMNSIRREQEATAFIADGTLPTSAGDIAQLILDGQFSDDDGQYTDQELDDASFYAYNIIKGFRGADDIPSQEGEGTDITSPSGEGELPGGQFYATEGRKLKLNETHHNYSSKDYYNQYKFGYGTWNVRTGDSFACLGNLYDSMRQNAIVISSVNPIDPELEAPSIAQYHLIDVFGTSISRFRYTTIAHNGNNFFGSFNIDTGDGVYMQLDDKINFYITDIITGLEKVGIHLDGDNSVIKMIGNIELHQHDDGDDDTFSVFDSKERKRVEILPRDIPNRTSQDAILAQIETRNIPNKFTTWLASKSYIHYEETGSMVGSIFGHPRRAKYVLNLNFDNLLPDTFSEPTYAFTCYGQSSIGKFGVDNSTDRPFLDVSDIHLKVDISDAYLLYGGNTERNLQRYIPIADLVGENGYVSNLRVWVTRYGSATPVSTITGPADITIANPSYTTTDGVTIDVNMNGIIFNDIEMYVYTDTLVTPEYYLNYSIEVSPFCYVEDIGRSQDYSFNGTASVVGNYTITFDRRDAGGTVQNTALSHMTIGTNGMVYNTSNSRYFYSADDGIEIKWDNTKITLDDGGLKIVPGIESSANKGPVIWPGSGWYQLPRISSFGLGRRLTILDPSTIEAYYEPIIMSIPWTSDGQTTSTTFNYIVMSRQFKLNAAGSAPQYTQNGQAKAWLQVPTLGCIELIAGNGAWHIVGGTIVSPSDLSNL